MNNVKWISQVVDSRSKNWFFLSLLLLGCFSFAGSTNTLHAYTLPADDGKSAVSTPELSYLKNISKGISALASNSKKALVFISTSQTLDLSQLDLGGFEFFFDPRYLPPEMRNRKREGVGSGFFVDLKKGYIITNNHVLEDADSFKLKLHNDKVYDGEIVGRDSNTDLAVVQIKVKKGEDFDRTDLAELVLHEGEVRVGELTLALGAPFSLESSLSFGVVSATGRSNMQVARLGSFIQTDAAINPGNSGGPLLNMDGQVIGVNTFIASRSGGSAGVGFALPSTLVRSRAQKLITDGKVDRGYIGVQLQDLSEDIIKGLGLSEGQQGVLVNDVVEDGPAQKAGITVGDVIIAVDGVAIKNSTELILTIGTKAPKSAVRVKVIRDGKKRDFRLSIAPWPQQKEEVALSSPDQEGSDNEQRQYGELGIKLSPLTPEIRRQLNIKSSVGFLVRQVEVGGPSYEAGLQKNDVLVSINKQPLTSEEILRKLVKQPSLVIRVEREGKFTFVAINQDK